MLSNYARVERLLKAMNIQEIYWKLFLKDKTFIINMDAVFMGFKHISTSQPLQIVHSFSLFKACSFFWMPLLLIFFFFFYLVRFFYLCFIIPKNDIYVIQNLYEDIVTRMPAIFSLSFAGIDFLPPIYHSTI